MSLSVFLPVRKGSQRVPQKNTREFAGIRDGLLELKLRQLTAVKYIDEIIVSTNDEACMRIAQKFQPYVKIDQRPEELSANNTSLTELIHYVPKIIKNDHIVWTHVTSPFFQTHHYENAIKSYFQALKKGFDSLMSVNEFKNFLWDKKKNDLINRNGNLRWPQTQDLYPYYEINSAIFITPRSIYRNTGDRVGQIPFLLENDKLTSLDIDCEEDFKIAEAVYEKFNK
jgi:CMP-N-acetylneuraminic acid synthetase